MIDQPFTKFYIVHPFSESSSNGKKSLKNWLEMILQEKLCKIINFDSNQSTTLSAIFWFSASSKSLQCSIFKYRRRLQDVLDCHPPTAAAKKPPTLTSTLLQQAVKVVVKLQDGRRYIVSDWQWRLCMSWSAPQVPPPERRQVQLGLYMAGIKRQAATWQAAVGKLK